LERHNGSESYSIATRRGIIRVVRKNRTNVPRELPVFAFFVALCLLLSVTARNFATAANLRVLGSDAAATGILAIGMTAVILTGGIDLSAAAVLALSALAGGSFLSRGYLALGLFASVAVGTMCGFINGTLVAYVKMPPIIATLGTLYIIQSAATLASRGQCIILDPNPVSFLGKGLTPLLVLFGISAAAAVVLKYTRFGRYIYAVGGNEESARLSGINPKAVKLAAYAANGFLAAVAGIVMLAIGSTFQANDAAGYELAAIAAVVIGGTSINGGRGSVFGTLIGIGITTVLRNGAILLGLEARWAQAIVGVALFLAVAVDRIRGEDSDR
jgi:ribose transport system permease protein